MTAPPTPRPPSERRTIIYTRVSTDDQAERGNSLRDQEARLREYCDRTGRTVVAHYQDDHSAKTFDRPQFNALLRFLESNRGAANELLVQKWDRFSRDATQAFNMVARLEELGVEAQAAEQPVDWSIPEQRMMVGVYFIAPEVENRRRSINAKTGMRRATRDGRWCNQPPVGYRRTRDERGRATIEPGDDADLVRETFRLAADTDLALEDIRRRMVKRGLKVSRSRFYVFLQNPVYKGRIRIEAWRDEPEEEVQGTFEPVLPPSLFDRVQAVRFGPPEVKTKRQHSGPRADLVLRGHLACPACSDGEPRLITGSVSRGRRGGRYAYYHCHRCGGFRARAEEAHDAFRDFVRTLQIAPEVAALHRAIARDLAGRDDRERQRELVAVKRELEAVEEKLFKADEALVNGDIQPESHIRLKKRYDREALGLRERVAEIGRSDGTFARRVTAAADLFEALPYIYDAAVSADNPEAVSDLVGTVAPEKVVYDGETVRTPFGALAKELFGPETQKKKDTEPGEDSVSCQACPGGFEPPTF